MKIRLFDESLDKNRVIDVLDKFLKDINPAFKINGEQFYSSIAVLGDQTDLSRDSLVVEDNNGKLIGFTGLLKSSKRDFWQLQIGILPEYSKSNFTMNLFESILQLAKEQNAPDIRFTISKYLFTDSLLEEKIKEMGLKPVHYDFWMILNKIDSIPTFKDPSGITFQNQKEISDVNGYLTILNDAFSKHFDFRPLTEEEFRLVFEKKWKEDDTANWLAFEGNKLIGICTLTINPELSHIGIIDVLGVLHENHHRGIGSSLLGHGIQSLIEKGCTTIELGVEATNEKALTLYKKFGFNEVESRTQIFYTIKV